MTSEHHLIYQLRQLISHISEDRPPTAGTGNNSNNSSHHRILDQKVEKKQINSKAQVQLGHSKNRCLPYSAIS